MEREEARRQQLDRFKLENGNQHQVYERLKKWADTQYTGSKEWLLAWAIPEYRQTPLPHVEELKSLAWHYYPPRSELKCHVCDFGEGRAEHKVVDLGELEEYWQTKPTCTYFPSPRSSFEPNMSLETCLGSFHSLDTFQGPSYLLKKARLTPKS